METQKFKHRLAQILAVIGRVLLLTVLLNKLNAQPMKVKNVVLVHGAFAPPITKAAWMNNPTYGLVATKDKSIAHEIQRAMYKRSNTLLDFVFATDELSNQI